MSRRILFVAVAVVVVVVVVKYLLHLSVRFVKPVVHLLVRRSRGDLQNYNVLKKYFDYNQHKMLKLEYFI